MKNKKGLSAIIVTLMMIAFALIAVGIVWVVINNVIEGGTDDIEKTQKCMDVDFTDVSMEHEFGPLTDNNYIVSLKMGTSVEDLDGVKLIFKNEDGDLSEVFDSEDLDVDGDFSPLNTVKITQAFADIGIDEDITEVQVNAYFGSDEDKQICSVTFSSLD